MKTSAKDAFIGGVVLVCISCAILSFAITDQILRGGAFKSTNIGGIGIGVMGILFAIKCLMVAKKKRNEETKSLK